MENELGHSYARRRRLVRGIGTSIAVVAAALVAVSPAQASVRFGYNGWSYGSQVVGAPVNSGTQVLSPLGCTRTVGLTKSNTLATLNVGGQVVAHSVATRSFTHNDSRGDGMTSYASAGLVQAGNLLTLSGAGTSARAVFKDGAFQTYAATQFTGVKIGGVSMPTLLKPAPNTKVNVPGLGYVVLNWTQVARTPQSASAKAAAAVIHATVSNPYLPVGATATVAVAAAGVGGSQVGLLRGTAFGTRAAVGGVLKSGPTSLQVTCFGTNGQTLTSNLAGVNIPNVATVNGITTSQSGTVRSDLASGWMSAGVAGVSLGGGRVKLTAVTAKAAASRTSAGKYGQSAVSSVGTLVIDGKSVSIPKLPNQQLSVPGVGYLIFNKTSTRTGFASITAVEAHLTAANAVLEIAHAESGVVG
ncbi:choice-of-anchor P family protein [Kribbella sp. GL6]|uniref:choice-of-anchor P family protein n=1 Tax=Kribbella sp. GL6 TaxID=3419765 RepID=UPI003D0163A8